MDSKIKVLIGDDSAEYGIACASSLRAAGLYVITRRKDGRTLVDAIQHDAPDVVIVDAVLPNLDAMELMRRVRSGTGKQPYFIVTSAYDSAFIEKQAMESGASYFMLKPEGFLIPETYQRWYNADPLHKLFVSEILAAYERTDA